MSRNPIFPQPGHIASVYRPWAADGTLLYVGYTTQSVAERMAQHANDPRCQWWPLMARLTSEQFPDMGPAKRAEDHAIATENPRFNRAGRPRADWVPRAAEAMPVVVPEPEKVGAHGSLLRMLLERPAVHDLDDASASLRVWVADHGGYCAASPPRLYVWRSGLVDWVMMDLNLNRADAKDAVDRLALTERRLRRRTRMGTNRLRWVQIDVSEFSADEWQMVIDVLPPRSPVRPDTVHDESSGRSGRRADGTYEGETF